MAFAVIELSGKQVKVKEKDVFKTEKLDIEPGKTLKIDDVLLYHDKETSIGTPTVKGASVTLTVKSHGKGKKIIVFKMKAKKRYRKTQGHRQQYTEVEVTKVTAVA